jgi:hypothetical protein
MWAMFSPAQQALMKMIYGLPLSSPDLAIWHALNGGGVYDHLGYLKAVHDSGVPYTEGLEYRDVTLIIGRRAAKSCILSAVCTYEALCGGHKARLQKDTQDPEFLLIGQDLKRAMKNKNEYILHYLKSSPAGMAQLAKADEGKKTEKKSRAITAKHIRLPDCGVIIVNAPSLKARGDATAFAGFDEVAFWQTDDKSANPDTEIERAVRPSMREFFPYAKLMKVSTPYTEEGLLWDMHQLGTHARHSKDPQVRAAHSHTVVFKGPSPVLDNPSIIRAVLEEDLAKDPVAYDRETLANFSKSVSGFLPSALVKRAMRGPAKVAPQPGVWYTAAMDPAFKNDAFAFSIGHLEAADTGPVFVQDVCTSWRGKKDQPLDPAVCVRLVADLCKPYGIRNVISDQHHLESMQTLAEDNGILIEPFVFTPAVKKAMWRDFVALMQQDKVALVAHDELESELLALERTLTAGGQEKIAGRRDDHAVVTAMTLHRALAFGVAAKPAERTPVTSDDWTAFATKRFHDGMRPTAAPRKWWNR